MRPTVAPVALTLLGVALLGLGCSRLRDGFSCASGDQCEYEGTGGTCERTGYCSFADPACGATGRRYSAWTAEGLADQCVACEDSSGLLIQTGTEDQTFTGDLVLTCQALPLTVRGTVFLRGEGSAAARKAGRRAAPAAAAAARAPTPRAARWLAR